LEQKKREFQEESRREIARNLLSQGLFSLEQIAQVSGLTVLEVKALLVG